MTRPPLLDTHALLWWVLGDPRLSDSARRLILDAGGAYASAASAWEIRTKFRLGKLTDVRPELVTSLEAVAGSHNFQPLPITFADGDLAGSFAADHKDPFDRMLAAQAINHRLALVSNDTALDAFGIVRVW